jgi:PEP-CTERM motif
MKVFYLGLCSALALLPTVRASTILFTSSALRDLTLDATGTYSVASNGGGITSQGFTGPSDSEYPNPPALVLDYAALAGTTVLDAVLDLTGVLSAGSLTSRVVLSGHGIHSAGQAPVFTAVPTGVFVSISGEEGRTQTLALSGITSYDLLPFFRTDLEAGNPLTISLSFGDVFGTSSPARSTTGHRWRNESATYTLSQTVSGTFTAFTQVDYLAPAGDPAPTPEPLTMVLSGAGLLALGMFGRRRKRG